MKYHFIFIFFCVFLTFSCQKKNNSIKNSNTVSRSETIDILQLGNPNLPVCDAKSSRSVYKIQAGKTELDNMLKEVDDFLNINQQDIQELLKIAQTFKNELNDIIQDPKSSVEEKEEAKTLLNLEEALGQHVENLRMNKDLANQANNLYYFNHFIENNYAYLIDFKAPKQVYKSKKWSLFSGNTVVTNVGLSGAEVTQIVNAINAGYLAMMTSMVAVIESNNSVMTAMIQSMTTVLVATVTGMFNFMGSLIGSSIFTPTQASSNSMKHFVAGGKNSALILNTIAKSGVQGEDYEKFVLLLGEMIEDLKLEDLLEKSFTVDLKPVLHQKGYLYYYFYIADQVYMTDKASHQLRFTPYFFRVDEKFSRLQVLNASTLERFLPEFNLSYRNKMGNILQVNSQARGTNAQGYQISVFDMPQGACVRSLNFNSELYSSKLFSQKNGSYFYQENLVD